MNCKLCFVFICLVSAVLIGGCVTTGPAADPQAVNIDEMFQLGQQYFLAGNFKAAAVEFRRIIKDNALHPKRPLALYWLAMSQINEGHTGSARTLCSAWTEILPPGKSREMLMLLLPKVFSRRRIIFSQRDTTYGRSIKLRKQGGPGPAALVWITFWRDWRPAASNVMRMTKQRNIGNALNAIIPQVRYWRETPLIRKRLRPG